MVVLVLTPGLVGAAAAALISSSPHFIARLSPLSGSAGALIGC
jgi:hypothetical protein